MKTILVENINCLIGGNAKENWQILTDASSDYLLFHLSSFPSCYVIYQDINIPDIKVLKEVALLCKQNTKYKNIPNIKVDYTKCSNVNKGDIEGEIYYKSNKKVNKIIV